MSANRVDDPRERLNYFNGQRLAASDFRAEQGHHDGMRRVLNRSLYSAGIVTGLEVELHPERKAHPEKNHLVKVRRGLAFDHLGREIFLPQDVDVPAMGAPSTTEGLVFGNLLIISYREQRKSLVHGGCAVASQAAPCSGDLAWGGPTRIAADATFEVLDSWPSADSGKVVIAQLELNEQCQVKRVLSGARQYAMPVKPQKVRPISLEGEKDIDIANEKTLHFHIEGGAPERAVLILRARKFSSLFYSEIGEHTHGLDLTIGDHPQVQEHKHSLGSIVTDKKLKEDTLQFRADLVSNDASSDHFLLWKGGTALVGPGMTEADDAILDAGGRPRFRVLNTEHSHKIEPGQLTDPGGLIAPIKHIVNGSPVPVKLVTDLFGAKAVVPPPHQFKRHAKPEYTYISNLRVVLDGTTDITDTIRAQLAKRPGEANKWDSLGNGTAGHAIASVQGTGEIDLLALGFELGMGPHTLSFRLVAPKPGDQDYSGDLANPGDRGGQIQYNLYID